MIKVLYGALWDMEQVYSGIWELGQLRKINQDHEASDEEMLLISCHISVCTTTYQQPDDSR